MRSSLVVGALVALNALLMIIGMGAGTGSSGQCQPADEGVGVRVGLVFDVGGLGDKSFNDAAYRGLVAARREHGVGYCYIEPGDGSDRESALRQLAARGFDLIIGVGFIFTDDITKLAGEFPAIKFAGIDYSASPDGPPLPANLVGLRFREHEGSFLVGAIAGATSKSKKVGFVGGMKIPLIRKFEAGYVAGVEHVCPDCKVLSAYAGSEPKAFADPTKGTELAMTQYGSGVDIIYHASGKTGAGVFSAAREFGKLAIGVDSDQYHEAPCCVLTSMVKRVDLAVVEVARQLVAGEFVGGVRELGLAEGGVTFVYDDNNARLLSAEVVARVRALAEEITAGKIVVPSR